MRCLKSLRHGFTLGTNSFPPDSKRPRGERGSVGGWSHGSTSRNIAFLRSVDETLLTGHALALTLTVRDCPPDSDSWHKVRLFAGETAPPCWKVLLIILHRPCSHTDLANSFAGETAPPCWKVLLIILHRPCSHTDLANSFAGETAPPCWKVLLIILHRPCSHTDLANSFAGETAPPCWKVLLIILHRPCSGSALAKCGAGETAPPCWKVLLIILHRPCSGSALAKCGAGPAATPYIADCEASKSATACPALAARS